MSIFPTLAPLASTFINRGYLHSFTFTCVAVSVFANKLHWILSSPCRLFGNKRGLGSGRSDFRESGVYTHCSWWCYTTMASKKVTSKKTRWTWRRKDWNELDLDISGENHGDIFSCTKVTEGDPYCCVILLVGLMWVIRKDFERSADFWVIYDESSNSQKISMRKCSGFPLRFSGHFTWIWKKRQHTVALIHIYISFHQ